jgi:hypothetical protein
LKESEKNEILRKLKVLKEAFDIIQEMQIADLVGDDPELLKIYDELIRHPLLKDFDLLP